MKRSEHYKQRRKTARREARKMRRWVNGQSRSLFGIFGVIDRPLAFWRQYPALLLALLLALATGCSVRTPEGLEVKIGDAPHGGASSTSNPVYTTTTATMPGGDFLSLVDDARRAWIRGDWTLAALLARRATAAAMRAGSGKATSGSGVDGVLRNAAKAEGELK